MHRAVARLSSSWRSSRRFGLAAVGAATLVSAVGFSGSGRPVENLAKETVMTSQFKYFSGKKLADPDAVRVFSGTANRPLAEQVAGYLGVKLGDITCERFADGEVNIKVNENVRGMNVVLIQSCTNNPSVSDSLMELLLMVSTMRRSSAKSITVVMPYAPYSRSDSRSNKRTPIASRDVMDMLTTVGMDRLVCVDMHSGQMQGFLTPSVPSDNISAISIGATYYSEKLAENKENVVVVAPNADGVHRAKQFWQSMIKNGVPARFAMVLRKPNLEELQRKERLGKTGSQEGLTEWKTNAPKEYEVVGDDNIDGCVAIIVDDILDSCESLCKEAESLKQKGAKKVLAFATHGIFSPGTLAKVEGSAIDHILVSNTAVCSEEEAASTNKVDWISVAPILAETIRRLREKESLSPLFQN